MLVLPKLLYSAEIRFAIVLTIAPLLTPLYTLPAELWIAAYFPTGLGSTVRTIQACYGIHSIAVTTVGESNQHFLLASTRADSKPAYLFVLPLAACSFLQRNVLQLMWLLPQLVMLNYSFTAAITIAFSPLSIITWCTTKQDFPFVSTPQGQCPVLHLVSPLLLASLHITPTKLDATFAIQW